MNGQFDVVKREAIPSIHTVDQNGEVHVIGEFRDFRWNAELQKFLQNATAFSVSWAVLRHREVLKAHVHPIQSMMVIYAGAGEVFGDLCRPLNAGEVLVVPAGCSHGFIGGPESMCAVTIQLGRGFYTNPDKPRISFVDDENSLQALVSYNEKRLGQFAKRPIFELLADDTLKLPQKRRAFLSAIQIWLDGQLAMLIERQSGCQNSRYAPAFLRHLQQELNSKFTNGSPSNYRTGGALMRDARMEAFTAWFAYQMSILDDAEKAAVVHFVVEGGTRQILQRAAPVLEDYVGTEYFKGAARSDEHIAVGMELLRKESPKAYTRLRQIVGEAWDMMGAMTDRVVEIARSA